MLCMAMHRTVQAWYTLCSWYAQEDTVSGAYIKGCFDSIKRNPAQSLWAQQIRGMVVCLVLHLVAAVDVEAHVVVMQGRAVTCGLLHPLCLLQGRELAWR